MTWTRSKHVVIVILINKLLYVTEYDYFLLDWLYTNGEVSSERKVNILAEFISKWRRKNCLPGFRNAATIQIYAEKSKDFFLLNMLTHTRAPTLPLGERFVCFPFSVCIYSSFVLFFLLVVWIHWEGCKWIQMGISF